jgi:hypothetical protein
MHKLLAQLKDERPPWSSSAFPKYDWAAMSRRERHIMYALPFVLFVEKSFRLFKAGTALEPLGFQICAGLLSYFNTTSSRAPLYPPAREGFTKERRVL